MANNKNFTFSPENAPDFRYEEDLTWLVVEKEEWDLGGVFGKSFSSFSVACLYALEHKDKEFVITLV